MIVAYICPGIVRLIVNRLLSNLSSIAVSFMNETSSRWPYYNHSLPCPIQYSPPL